MPPGTDFILNALSKEGLTHLFMVPGGLVDPFLPALARQNALRPIVAAHEAGAAFMADGYARASGRFGAALGIGGPGLCNMACAVAGANSDSSPVLVISGEVPLEMEGLGEFQDASQATFDDTAIMRPLTRLSATVVGANTLNHWLRRAIATMQSRPRGPVHLSLTQDVLTGSCETEYEPVSGFFKDAAAVSPAESDAALDSIKARVAILAGAGVEHDDAAAELKDVAERWSIPIATTLRAKGVFPEDHPLSLGVFGYAGTRHATAAILGEGLETLIVLGSGLSERDTMHWTLQRACGDCTIQVNTDSEELATLGKAGRAVWGSCRAFLDRLMKPSGEVANALERGRAARSSWLASVAAGPRLYDTENCARSATPVHPATIVAALRTALPRDGIVLVDSGAHRAFAGHYWTAFEPRTYISATNLGPMGWAIPAAVGVQCARPGRRVAVVTGDGCMQMHGIEVQTAARYGLPIVYVVINNGALGNVWLRAHKEGALPAELTSIPDHDWAGFARAFGAQGLTVREPSELRPAFEKALAANSTVVIDVKADKDCPTPVYDFQAGTRAWSYHE